MDIGLGAIRSTVDARDYKVVCTSQTLPPTYQVPGDLPVVKSQGAVGSCVAHALSSILEYHEQQECGNYRKLSTDFIYGLQREVSGRTSSGMVMRDACKIARNYGDVPHEYCSTNTEMPKAADKAEQVLSNAEACKFAEHYKVKSYARCSDEKAIKHAIMQYGPCLAAIQWYKDYNIDDLDRIHFSGAVSGGHAFMIYGWNGLGWLCQNSWGKWFGNDGRFILPYSQGVRECWSLVDAANGDIVVPKRNTFLDYLYMFGNAIANLIQSIRNICKSENKF